MSADVVWSRYNAMVVADTVLFGFLTQEHVPCLVKIWGSVTGIAVTVCWWLLTSYGWSLLHAEKAVTKKYKDWRGKSLLGKSQDPIWWCAHAVIWIFYSAYGALLLFYLNEKDPSSRTTCAVGAAVFVVFVALFAHTLFNLDIRRDEFESAEK